MIVKMRKCLFIFLCIVIATSFSVKNNCTIANASSTVSAPKRVANIPVAFSKNIEIKDSSNMTLMNVLVSGTCTKTIYSSYYDYHNFTYNYSVIYRGNSSYNVTGVSVVSVNNKIRITVNSNVGSGTEYIAP